MVHSYTRDSSPPSHLVFTDLDGTLLDHDTYSWNDALPALDLCRKRGVPVILVSSKTSAEMVVLHRNLNLSAPFVSENGGGVFFPKERFKDAPDAPLPAKTECLSESKDLWQWSLGTPYSELVRAFRDIRNELGWEMKGFSEMDVAEITELTGLDENAARLAAMRDYDEPFIFVGDAPNNLAPLHDRAAQRGLTIVSGGRFHHLLGNNHKGEAMALIASWYDGRHAQREHDPILTIALGDSPNDFSMLSLADIPILIRSERDFPELARKIPRLRITRYPGPRGWNIAILNILKHSKETADA